MIKDIEFGDWKLAGREHGSEDLIKESNNTLNNDKIYLSKFYFTSANHYWFVIFSGPNINHLQKIYYELYPLETNYFLIYQVELEEVKSHVDKFLQQIDFLIAFL